MTDDDWPPPDEYLGRPTSWERIVRAYGDPVRHAHSCLECYAAWYCYDGCTLEPDLEGEDGTPFGSHTTCLDCLSPSERQWREMRAASRRHLEVAIEQLSLNFPV